MAKKTNLKAEKAKRNREYARKFKKRRPFGGRGPRRPFGPRPTEQAGQAGQAGQAAPAKTESAPAENPTA